MPFQNLSPIERTLRLALGILMLALGWLDSHWALTMPLRIFALYPLITGLIGWCPIYTMLRFDSRR